MEGPTDDPKVLELRARLQRNFLATLFLSQGVPMLLYGDELGRTQGGNNNAYCQDNEISWIDWDNIDHDLLDFTRSLVSFVKAHPTFHRRQWFQGRQIHGSGVHDIHWLRPDGHEMTDADWDKGFAKSLAVFLNGREIASPGPRGERITDDTFLILLNAHHEAIDFVLPGADWGRRWRVIFDTANGRFDRRAGIAEFEATKIVTASDRSLILLQQIAAP